MIRIKITSPTIDAAHVHPLYGSITKLKNE